MSYQIPGLVETSSNLATVNTKKSMIEIVTSQRSSIMSRLSEITGQIKAISDLAGAETEDENAYPAWKPRMDSPLLSRCVDIYTDLYGNKPKIEVIHAGLECGVIGAKYPDMDMISFGPTIKGAHSPDEKLHIPSVGKILAFLTALLIHGKGLTSNYIYSNALICRISSDFPSMMRISLSFIIQSSPAVPIGSFPVPVP
jgi:dipeptidase D